jgi:molecular chaperone DnaK
VAFDLSDYFQNQGQRLVAAALHRAVGKPSVYVLQEDHYRQSVVQPGWESLPAPVRLLLRRRHDEWNQLFVELRDLAYDLGDGSVKLRPDAAAKMGAVLRRYYPSGAGQPQPAGAGATVAPAATPGDTDAAPRAGSERETTSEAAAPQPHLSVAVGIDLGTTYSLVAHLDAQGRPVCIPNVHGELLTPSVVLFEEGGTIVGKEAVLASAAEPDRVAECVKRDMGAKAYRKPINGEFLPPEVISSLVLRNLKADAERKLGGPVKNVVITVPAYFEETRRRATMDAGKLAGLEVLDIINEPTAAAVAYGYHLGFLDRTCKLTGDKPLRVLVFDLGGGTFDVTIVAIQGTEFKALATDGDVQLGGKDWDEQLMNLVAERFRHQIRVDLRENPFSRQELWLAAESAKRTLTERKKATIHINHLGNRVKTDVSREEFEEVTAGLLERTRLTTEIVVRQAGLGWADIDRVLLVGGSTRMPMVRRMLRELTSKEPEASINPDEAVAHGAALYAELLAPRHESKEEPAQFSVTNVNSHSLGILGSEIETGRKVNKILIPKNSPLPRTVSKVFKTFRPNQRNVQIKVLEGESDRPEVCTVIGVCAIHDLPPDLPAGWPVRVSYSYEANGRLHVSAQLQGHTASVSADFERENRLPDEDLDMWAHFIADELSEQEE